jgi:hypothetical protein
MKETIIVQTEHEQANIDKHSSHRTKEITTSSDRAKQFYCLDCEVKYSAGAFIQLGRFIKNGSAIREYSERR